MAYQSHTLIAVLVICCNLSAADLWVGTWKLNPEKSKGGNINVSKFERKGDIITNSNGQMSHQVVFDGKEYPVTGSVLYDHATWKRIDPFTFEHTMKKDGKEVYRVRTVVAKDGKTRTWSNYRSLPDGTEVESKGVHERTGGEIVSSNPLLGSWRQSPMMNIEAKGDGIRVSSGTILTANFDGKDYPIVGTMNPVVASIKRIDPRTMEQSIKRDGKIVSTSNWSVSPDGATLTVSSKGTRPDGQPFNSVAVWEKVR